MPRFGAIDVGSNATRLYVVEASGPDELRVIHRERRPVRMGHNVFLTGLLEEDAIEACLAALSAFSMKLDELEVDRHRAVITASARGAKNAPELLRRAWDAGVRLEAIDGAEEARLIRLAVDARLGLSGRRSLLVDLGGGSLELSEVHHDEVRFSTSIGIGTVRLLESFFEPDARLAAGRERVLVEHIERMLEPFATDYLKRSYDLVAGTGGNFGVIAKLCPLAGAPIATIDMRAARRLRDQMVGMTKDERRDAWALRDDRADVIVPALFVLEAVAKLARTDQIVTPEVGLKEGLVRDLAGRHFGVWGRKLDEHLATRAAILLGRRFHFDEPHATQVDRLASELFDRLEPVHGLPPEDRALLRVAALTHDIGDFVDYAGHHKHTQYILEHSEIVGLSIEERSIVGCVARYHRRSPPSTKHELYRSLSREAQDKVRRLAAILRIADALDRGHRSKVRGLEVSLAAKEITIEVSGGDDLALEIWAAERKGGYFGELFGRKVAFVATPA